MLKIGLTGGIGSGKSTVAALFQKLGIPSLDADQIGKALLKSDPDLLAQIQTAFGAEYLDEQGQLKRDRLRQLILFQPEAKQKLEQIMHPAIRHAMQNQIKTIKAPYVLLEIPLLLEKGWQNEVDRVLVIDAPETEQIKRVRQRSGWSVAEIQQMMAQQMSRQQRLKLADDIVDNQGDLAALQAQVQALHRFYLSL